MKYHFILSALCAAMLLAWGNPCCFAQKYVVSTLAGSGSPGFVNGAGSMAQFEEPSGVAIDNAGNLYVTEYDNHSVRQITPNGEVTTLAGNGLNGSTDGDGATAQFYNPTSVAIDGAGNLYVADYYNHRIRKIAPNATGTGITVTTVAGSSGGYLDGDGATAKFSSPQGVAVDAAGNIYVADAGNNRIRKITPISNGTLVNVSTVAGSTSGFENAFGTMAKFAYPTGVAVDSEGNIYVADRFNHCIRKIQSDGTVKTMAGTGTIGTTNGSGTIAKFKNPRSVALDNAGNLYVADQGNHRIRKITPIGNGDDVTVTTLAGSTEGFSDGAGASAKFAFPSAVTVDGAGNLYVTDVQNHRIRKMIPLTCSSSSPLAVNVGTHVSAIEGPDEGGWKSYCNDVGELLLSLSLGASGAVIPDYGVELNIQSTAASYYSSGTGFITTPGGAAFFNKTWEVSPTIQPTGSVGVRNYFTQADYNAVNAELTTHSQSPAPALTSLNFYKVTDASLGEHPAIPSITSDKVIIIRNGSAPSTNIWQLGTRAPGSEYYAEFQVTGFSGGGGGSGAAGAALPVTLVAFDATKKEQQALLTWRTATELNSDHFDVQRSADGKTWNKLGEVAAAKNTNVEKQYSFTDQQPLRGQNLYRLKMIDLDESFAYSRVRDITFGEVAGASLYPNPARETITLNLDKKYTGTTAKLTSLSGVIIRQIPISSTTQPVALHMLSPGLYFLKLYDGSTIKVIRE